jgi:hypothetical protein
VSVPVYYMLFRLGLVRFVGASFGVECTNLGHCITLGFMLFVSVSFFVPYFGVSVWCYVH